SSQLPDSADESAPRLAFPPLQLIGPVGYCHQGLTVRGDRHFVPQPLDSSGRQRPRVIGLPHLPAPHHLRVAARRLPLVPVGDLTQEPPELPTLGLILHPNGPPLHTRDRRKVLGLDDEADADGTCLAQLLQQGCATFVLRGVVRPYRPQ